jgi:N,N'-diacetyllegionaminate synthase
LNLTNCSGELGARKLVSVICEIASSHGGEPKSLLELLDAAEQAQADWVKIQIFKADSLVAPDNTAMPDFQKIEIAPSDWVDILEVAAGKKPKLIVEFFDRDSFDELGDVQGIDAYKIATADLSDNAFTNAVCARGKPIFIGVGGATVQEVDAICEVVRAQGVGDLVLLHGFQNFPTKLEDSILDRINWLKDRYDCTVGFADHIDAEQSEMARTLPAMAVAAGAEVIEKHITLDRAQRGYDYYSALNPSEFADFVKHIKEVAKAIGHSDGGALTPSETEYREKMKKFALLTHPADSGTPIGELQLHYCRTKVPGLTRSDVEKLSSRKLRHDMAEGSVLLENCID